MSNRYPLQVKAAHSWKQEKARKILPEPKQRIETPVSKVRRYVSGKLGALGRRMGSYTIRVTNVQK